MLVTGPAMGCTPCSHHISRELEAQLGGGMCVGGYHAALRLSVLSALSPKVSSLPSGFHETYITYGSDPCYALSLALLHDYTTFSQLLHLLPRTITLHTCLHASFTAYSNHCTIKQRHPTYTISFHRESDLLADLAVHSSCDDL